MPRSTAERHSPRRAALAWLAAVLCLAPGCRTRTEGDTSAGPESAEEPNAAEAEPAASAGRAGEAGGDESVRIVYPNAPGSFVDLVDEVGPSVVHIRSATPVKGGPADALLGAGQPSHALGSGFVVDNAGHVLTNDHVVASAGELRVVAGGTELPARVIGRDAKLDVALLEVDARPGELRPARLGSSKDLRTGEWVVALGNPFGDEVAAAAGIVSALGAGAGDAIAGQRVALASFLRVDAAIDAGLSGGPLVDTAGEVVGMATAVERRGAAGGFAVPIDRATQILPMLRDEGRVTRAWLGVFVHPVTADTAARLGLEAPTGALVSDVVAGSPAARARIEPGDVILRFDGEEVDSRSLPWRAATAGIGRRIDVEVWRNGARRELTLVSEKMPE